MNLTNKQKLLLPIYTKEVDSPTSFYGDRYLRLRLSGCSIPKSKATALSCGWLGKVQEAQGDRDSDQLQSPNGA